jgi:hypothetical protein
VAAVVSVFVELVSPPEQAAKLNANTLANKVLLIIVSNPRLLDEPISSLFAA